MILINNTTGKQLIIGRSYPLVVGRNKGQKVTISELVDPSEHNHKGFVDVDRTGITFQRYYPEVLGAHFEGNLKAAEIEALPVPVVAGGAETLTPISKNEALKRYSVLENQPELSTPPGIFFGLGASV